MKVDEQLWAGSCIGILRSPPPDHVLIPECVGCPGGGHTEAVQALVAAKASLELTDESQYTPLLLCWLSWMASRLMVGGGGGGPSHVFAVPLLRLLLLLLPATLSFSNCNNNHHHYHQQPQPQSPQPPQSKQRPKPQPLPITVTTTEATTSTRRSSG